MRQAVPQQALRRLTLLCSASVIAMGVAGSAHAGQLAASAFQVYDPTTASTIVPGALALFQVPVDSLRPTQMNEGFTEVGKKAAGFDLLAPSQLQSNLLTDIEPVVIGPGGQLYLTDGHHTFTALQDSSFGASNPNVFVNVIANYSNLTMAQFFATMQSQNLLLPLNDGVPQTVNAATGAPIPTSLTGLTSDPYRGLEYSILKNKSSKLFTTSANITGAVGASTPGLDKMTGFYSDFFEAAAYRGANNGLGLAYLSPGDIAIATKWNLTASSQTTLPNVAGTVTAAQLPGFILSNNLTVSSVISNSTLSTGALDGNGGFTGITTINAGTAANPITVGTPNVGFIMQLGNDDKFSVALSGANTYTGGTSILAGNLIVANDGALGAAAPAGATIDLNNIKTSVQAANGIIFNSLTEGNGTLTLGTLNNSGNVVSGAGANYTLSRTIAVGGEAATISINDFNVTLNGQLVSLGVGPGGTGIGNATGFSDLTIDDISSAGKGVLTLSTASPDFFGNIIIGSSGTPTVKVMSDAALGNTTGPAASIGQIELNGGTLQAGASFTALERNIFLGGGSTFDVNGFTTSWGTLSDAQRTLDILNSNTTTAGAVTFNNLAISSTATLQLAGGAAGETVTLTNGINRTAGATLIIQPTSASSLGTATEKLFSGVGAASLVNTATDAIAPVYIVTNNGVAKSGGPYDFVTYGANGYVKATYSATTLTNAPGSVVALAANTTAAGNVAAFALNTEGKTINLGGQTLTIGDGTNAGGLILASGSAISNGTLAFGGSEGVIWLSGSNPTISASITGSNGLTFAGSGGVALSTAANVSGAINIDSGTVTLSGTNIFASNSTGITLSDVKKSPAPAVLTVTANNTLASLNSAGSNSTVNISNGAALTIGDTVNNLSSTLSSTIAQTGVGVVGALTKNGSGMLDLSGSAGVSFAAGSTVVVNGGVLRIANGIFGASATTPIDLAGAGTELQYAGNGGSKFNDPIQGLGIFHLIGGTVQFTSTANTYSGGTVVEQGSTLDLTTANVSSGNANIINAGGLVVFDQATNGTYSGVISDGRQMEATSGPMLSGSLVKDDSTGSSSGNLTLAAVQAYSGGTFVEAGTLTLGVANAIAGSSGVDLGRVGGPQGTGAAASGGPVTATLALSANNTVQGLMDEAGNHTAVLLNGNTLTMNVTSGLAFNYAGVISGTGGLIMTGTGSETLGGASTYTGTTIVNGGLLNIDGSIASSSLTTVNAAGALGGTGIVGNTFINGGTLAPGYGSGTLTVSGNLAFTTAAAYLIGVSQSGSALTSVTGTATLAGTVMVVSPTGTYKFEQPYTILSAAGGLGGTTFNALALPDFIAGSLSYTSTNAQLTLALALGQLPGLNANQTQVASAIDRAVNASGSLPSGFANLLNLSPAALPGALSQLSGEIGTGAQQTTFGAMTQFVSSLMDHMSGADAPVSTPGASPYADDPSAANAYASNNTSGSKSERDAYAAIYNKATPRPADPFAQSWSVWAGGFGGSQTTDGNASLGSSGSTSQIYGSVVGADYRISPFTVAGLALAGGGTNFSVNGLGTGRSDLFQAGVFIKHTVGAAYISGALGYGWQNITTDRTVSLAGVDQLRANFDANAFSGRLEGGYRFVAPWMSLGVTPYLAGQFTTFELPAYAEQALAGSNAFALSYASQSVTDSRSELGLRTDKSYALTNAVLTLRGRLAWAHDFDTDRSAAATFQSLPGASFVVNGAAPAHDSALTTASAEVKWLNGFSVAATFEGEFSDVTQSYAGKGTVRYSW
ncbi:autotransporter domain-containing protein [Bradyrhizobium sp. S69]|uniref:autotransporter domain-containing protein n=1 Tax=Bradyrhizobium sp. S69 TaxID=1641856 RepID=UPI00131E4D05|nr:autotransporter domain-containing protein [Bradyrhizobium sp. S69]